MVLDEENNKEDEDEDEDNDGDDEDDFVLLFVICVQNPHEVKAHLKLPSTPRPTAESLVPRHRGFIHTPPPRIHRESATADYPLSGIWMTNAGS